VKTKEVGSVRHSFFVPVRTSKAGTLALQTGRLLTGERIGLAFTSEATLLLTLGPSQQWIRLDEEALKDMLAPLGVEHVRVDPRPAGELVSGGPLRERRPGRNAGLPRFASTATPHPALAAVKSQVAETGVDLPRQLPRRTRLG
jgi:hypothetical protein